jgi:pimeloyl-ACP methyl ester carboxylesterase
MLVQEVLALPLPKGYADVIIAPNPVEADLALGTWKAPRPGERVTFANGETTVWRTISADEKGWFSDSVLAGCYLYFPVEMKRADVMMLVAKGNEIAYVNGAPRAGNPYCLKDERESWEPDFDISRLPVLLERGRNDFVFRCMRGRFNVELCPPQKPIAFNVRDITVPDFVVGDTIDTWGAIVVVNATMEPLKDLLIQASIPRHEAEHHEAEAVPVPVIAPLTIRKIGFHLTAAAPREEGALDVALNLVRKNHGRNETLDAVTLPFRVVNRYDNRRETFISSIDGSVQYYAINPARSSERDRPVALFLTLHGASVEAVNQSASYEAKTWGHIVAPTNRRPYGFNWEEWGRLDALEALDVVKQRYRIDESRIYLTGHSMGGHGAWHIGSLFPDQFAAIGPSAGWISFWTYRFPGIDRADTSAVRRMIRRATTTSETLMQAENLGQLGVYVLHGADDDNVPVGESRVMVDALKTFHKDCIYHEQPGVGHWWDILDEPGVDCVDWAPLFDFFARHARPGSERIREVHFLTSNPGVSAKNNWLTIDAQIEQLKISSVSIRFDPGANRFAGTTKNVSRLAFDLDMLRTNAPLKVELDGQPLTGLEQVSAHGQLWLERTNGVWAAGNEPPAGLKGSRRYGTLKEAFRNRMIFVYGSSGTRAENEWAFNKARYDAEKLWYQGNGSVDIVADVDFDPAAARDRNIVVYGNKTTNTAWKTLLSESPVQVGRSRMNIGGRTISGDTLCCLFVRPRAGSRTASIGVISGTGVVGMRLANRLPYLSPGINLPDCTVLGPSVLTAGEPGVIMTGFFGLDWGVPGGEAVWNRR